MTLYSTLSTVDFYKRSALIAFLSCFIHIVSAQESSFMVLNYHDLINTQTNNDISDAVDLSVKHFEEQLHWLKNNHYQVISVQQDFDAYSAACFKGWRNCVR